ncbi:unnamed protein product [Paramecium pentaurelia]|uniref:Protein kinase domain-containing protein n=1 Tax=Paramecium pentaurelia TaxID=43138 RepID=A0A8S1SAS5_9CILI|nr:unnamed protein product [Paramecium pentaurelia]
MFRKQDFKKLELLGSGKKHTKIYRVQHIQTNKIYALKEIEATNLEKLNEYKEEAVQLSKVQNCGNVIRFYGYYFAETLYNTFRLGIITEYMDHNTNLENLYRKRKKPNQFWKENELVTMLFSIISTCSYLQQKGICHRDIKPANLFMITNGELKLIDFGESKDYFFDLDNEAKNTYTMATIRGTPQYLSPILWKAHVIDGNSRYVEHNIYKSDVFSTGLVMYQMSAMQEVTGFNNTQSNEGEQLILQSLAQLEQKYSPAYVSIIKLMLIFEEAQRPSYVEIEQLFIEHEEKYNSGKISENVAINEYILLYNQHYNTMLKRGPPYRTSQEADVQFKNVIIQHMKNGGSSQVIEQSQKSKQPLREQPSSQKQQQISQQQQQSQQVQVIKQPVVSQSAFYKDSTLILNDSCLWFEFGGKTISKFSTSKQKWRQIAKLDVELDRQFTTLFVPDKKAFYLIGGFQETNFRVYQNDRLELMKHQIPMNRFFCSCLYYNQKIYCIGGYDEQHKIQLSSVLYYDLISEKWVQLADLKQPKSQAAACRINDNEIVLFGGYNKEEGTLDNIERYLINENKWEKCNLKLPLPLRRFMAVRVKKNLALLIGGLTMYAKESQKVLKVDWEKKEIIECEPLEKGGIVESEVLLDNEGNLHIFLENANGTSPHAHIKYYFDPNATKYETKAD